MSGASSVVQSGHEHAPYLREFDLCDDERSRDLDRPAQQVAPRSHRHSPVPPARLTVD